MDRANDLPFLNVKEDHILSGSVMDVADTDAVLISLDNINTVCSLKKRLSESRGWTTGFPIVREIDGLRLQGYVGFDELHQALESFNYESDMRTPSRPCNFRDLSSKVKIDPLADDDPSTSVADILELGYLADRAPPTIATRAPLQLVHQMFVKLGVRYLAVQDERGCYVGIIEKNR